MSVEVHLTPSLHYVISDVKSITIEGKTVGECLDSLGGIYPQLEPLLFSPAHKLRGEYTLFINGEYTSPDDLDRPVNDGDKLNIVDIIIGG